MRLQKDFPLLELYKEKFQIDDKTIFAYNGEIYSNEPLRPDLLIHELHHLKQQEKIGADEWVKRYLEDKEFRLAQEMEAFRVQINSIKDRNKRFIMRRFCASDLSSGMYGIGMSFAEAMKLLE